jgi:Cu2+-exporting ATPase
MSPTDTPRPREVIGVACTHCGLAVPAGLRAEGSGPQFCCAGCRTVYDILQANGLSQYYRLGERREAPVRSTGRSFEEFDHPAFHELYVRATADGLSRTELYLEGVHCASCVWLVERVPLIVPRVARAELDVRRSLARVEWDADTVPLSEVARTLDRLGYTPHPFRGVARDEMRRREDRRMLMRIGVAGAIAGNVMLAALALYSGQFQGMEGPYFKLFRWVSLGLTVPALLFPGRVFFAGAIGALRTRALHMDLPIALALSAATLRGAINTISNSGPIYFDGVTLLIFLLLVGRFLQQRGQRTATDAAELLYSLAPGTARIREPDGRERELPASAVLPGMIAMIRAGEVFPADGVVTAGVSDVNAALLTGESRPVAVGPGDPVFAGTQNVTGPVEMRVEEAGEASRLARILRQVEEGATRRAPVILLADRMAGWFVATVLVLAGITFLLWHGRAAELAWDHAMALLIVTCPCALALATPLAVTMAIGRAARAGIFIKGGDALERLARPGLLLLDKTGTLTEGRTELVRWIGDDALRPMILALEAGSSHPVAEGFRRAWPGVAPAAVTGALHTHGGGVVGVVRGVRVRVGSPAFVSTSASGVAGLVARLADATLTPVVVAVDGEAVAVAGMGDRVRPDAAAALSALRTHGWRTALLSGDDARVAAAVGAGLGFPSGAVVGGATPEAKLAFVADRMAERTGDQAVVMVGDGVNDAAAMAAASVGVGVHGGAEASLATADVYLTTPGVAPLVHLVEGAARTMRVIRRNIAWAIGYNLVGVALAMTGHISPLVAALLMPASSLTVLFGSWIGRTFDADGPGTRDPRPGAVLSSATDLAA